MSAGLADWSFVWSNGGNRPTQKRQHRGGPHRKKRGSGSVAEAPAMSQHEEPSPPAAQAMSQNDEPVFLAVSEFLLADPPAVLAAFEFLLADPPVAEQRDNTWILILYRVTVFLTQHDAAWCLDTHMYCCRPRSRHLTDWCGCCIARRMDGWGACELCHTARMLAHISKDFSTAVLWVARDQPVSYDDWGDDCYDIKPPADGEEGEDDGDGDGGLSEKAPGRVRRPKKRVRVWTRERTEHLKRKKEIEEEEMMCLELQEAAQQWL